MRILALAIFAIGMMSIGPATAQTYDRAYPVCLRVHAHYYECSYTSLPQCNASASGRAAQCKANLEQTGSLTADGIVSSSC